MGYNIMYKRFIYKVLLLCLMVYFSGCKLYLLHSSHDISDNFIQVVKEWTRSKVLYKKFDTILVIDALYKSPLFKAAFIDQIAASKLLTDIEKEKLIDKKGKYLEFLIAVYTGDEEWNDLDKEDAEWTIILEDKNGNLLRPKAVETIKHTDIPLQDLYTFITPWKRLYTVKFDRKEVAVDTNSTHITLFVSSIMGRVELVWE